MEMHFPDAFSCSDDLRKHSHPAVSTPACAITWTKFPLEAAGTACPATSTSVSDSELTQTGSGLNNVLDEEASLKGRLARLELEVDQLKQRKFPIMAARIFHRELGV